MEWSHKCKICFCLSTAVKQTYLQIQRRPSAHAVLHIPQEVHWWCLVPPAGKANVRKITRATYRIIALPGKKKICIFFISVSLYLRNISSSSETKCDGAHRFGHESHRDLVPTIPHCLDGLADISVVVRHADVLCTDERKMSTESQLQKKTLAEELASMWKQNHFLTMNGVLWPRARNLRPSPCKMLIIPWRIKANGIFFDVVFNGIFN